MEQNPFFAAVSQLVKKFLAKSGTPQFITPFTRDRSFSQSAGTSILSTSLLCPISLKFEKYNRGG